MTETLGPFTVDAAEGILKPAVGTVEDPPTVFNYTQSTPVASYIETVAAFATVTLAFDEAQDYRTLVGSAILFRGITCMVIDVEPDHRKAKQGEQGEGVTTARWTLAATYTWVPV